MDVALLEKEIKDLRSKLYELGRETNKFSQGEILKVSQELDKKIVLYQKTINDLQDFIIKNKV